MFGDIAIDDAELMQASVCASLGNEYRTTTEEQEIEVGIAALQSCKERCDETAPANQTQTEIKLGSNTRGLQESCDCHMGCLDSNSCCPDYIGQCLYANKSTSEEATIATTIRTTTTSTERRTVQPERPVTAKPPKTSGD